MDEDINQKIELVDKGIDEFARNLATDDKDLQGKLKTEIREIILQNDLKNSNEETAVLIKALIGDNLEANTDTIIKAKEASLGLNMWIMKNIEAVREYRGENLKTKLVEETKKNNSNITDDHIRIIRRLADNINKVYNSNGGIEDQKDVVLEEHKNESPGKIKNAWNDIRGIVGLMKKSPEQLDETVKNDEEINRDIQKHGIKINYQQSDILASYDRVMSSIKKPEVKKSIESSGSRFKTLDKISNGKFSQIANNFAARIGGDRFRNIAYNFFNKPIVQVSKGFASKIGNQTAKSFVQNSMGTLLKNGVSNGMNSIIQGAMRKGAQLVGKATINVATKMGFKAAALGLKAAAGAATAGVGFLVMAGWEALKVGGKLIKKLINTFSFNSNDDKDDNLIIYILIGLFVFLVIIPVIMASTLVPTIESPGDGGENQGGSLSHGEVVIENGKVISCGVGMETEFWRKNNPNKPRIQPLSENDLEKYNKQLEEFVGDQFGKRCGIVYAAQYLAYDFDFWVPYYFAGQYPQKGLNPSWGENKKPDQYGNIFEGLDCGYFRMWVWPNSGFSKFGPGYREIYFNGDCEKIKSVIQPGDTLAYGTVGVDYHSGIVLEFDGDSIKYAHSGSRSGVTTGLINICTGKKIGPGNPFDRLQVRNIPL